MDKRVIDEVEKLWEKVDAASIYSVLDVIFAWYKSQDDDTRVGLRTFAKNTNRHVLTYILETVPMDRIVEWYTDAPKGNITNIEQKIKDLLDDFETFAYAESVAAKAKREEILSYVHALQKQNDRLTNTIEVQEKSIENLKVSVHTLESALKEKTEVLNKILEASNAELAGVPVARYISGLASEALNKGKL